MADPLYLALDASTPQVSLALGRRNAGLVARMCREPDAQTRSHLANSLKALLAVVDAHPTEIQGILVGLGPGNFTSLRSAHAFARGFADAARRPLHGWSSMLATAVAVGERTVAVVHDARRKEVFLSIWEDENALLPPRLVAREEVVERLKCAAGDRPLTLTGTALDLLAPHAIPDHWSCASTHPEPALGLLRLWQRTPDEQLPGITEPHYLRAPDARAPQSAADTLAALRLQAAKREQRRSR